MRYSCIKKKIYYYDTDCGGVVYYANYLKYLEEGRTELFSQKGISLKELAQNDTMFVVARLNLEYKAPAHYQDIIKVFTSISEIKHSSLEFIQEIKHGDIILVKANTTLVCISQSFKPRLISQKIKNYLSFNDELSNCR